MASTIIPDNERCTARFSVPHMFKLRRCLRRRVVGEFCTQHSPDYIKKQDAKRQAAWDAKAQRRNAADRRRSQRNDAFTTMLEALKEIRDLADQMGNISASAAGLHEREQLRDRIEKYAENAIAFAEEVA